MAAASVVVSADVAGELASLAALLADPAVAPELEPEVTAVEELAPRDGAERSFRLTESTRRGPLLFAVERRVDLVSATLDDDGARVVTRTDRAFGERSWTEATLAEVPDAGLGEQKFADAGADVDADADADVTTEASSDVDFVADLAPSRLVRVVAAITVTAPGPLLAGAVRRAEERERRRLAALGDAARRAPVAG